MAHSGETQQGHLAGLEPRQMAYLPTQKPAISDGGHCPSTPLMRLVSNWASLSAVRA